MVKDQSDRTASKGPYSSFKYCNPHGKVSPPVTACVLLLHLCTSAPLQHNEIQPQWELNHKPLIH